MPSCRNPIFSEGIEVYFSEEKILRIYQVVIVILALSVFLSWPKKPFNFFLALSANPPTYSIMIIAVFIIATYLSVRFGLQSDIRHRFKSTANWLSLTAVPIHRIAIGKLGMFFVHSLFLAFLALPFLIVAASPSGVSLSAVLSSLLVVFICTLTYRITAFLLLVVFEKNRPIAGWILWTLVLVVCVVSLYLFPKASPVLNLLKLAGASPDRQQDFQAFGIVLPYRVGTLRLHIILGLLGTGASVLWLMVRRRLHYNVEAERKEANRANGEDRSRD